MRTNGSGWLARLALVAMVAGAGVACGPKAPPITELSPAQLWERGQAAYEEEEWDDALRYLDRFALVGGSDPRVDQARYDAADAHFQKGEYITAAAEFARLASDQGRGELGDDARFMTCRSYEELSPRPQLDQEYTRAAIDHCSALVDYFPDSEYAGRAGEIVTAMYDKLAEKVYQTGDWYHGRDAYDSALIYFEDVVALYPTSRWAPEALRSMVEIYEELEWANEREETLQRLLDDYPESQAARALAADGDGGDGGDGAT